MRPAHVAHDGVLLQEPLVNADVENIRQIEGCRDTLIEEDRLERAWLWIIDQAGSKPS